jgi:uncharacterized protein DUF6940
MWRIDRRKAGLDAAHWKVCRDDGSVLSFQAQCAAWRLDAAFRSFWVASLRDIPFDAFAWECPPVTAETFAREFECVFVSSPMLAGMPPDSAAFAEHFRPDSSVVTFKNLGGDAVLVAPSPGGPGSDFSHLASFTATAPAAQQDALWQAVGDAMDKRIGLRPVWLSTAGLGVAWLHVRLDDRPKYYRHMPYASASA